MQAIEIRDLRYSYKKGENLINCPFLEFNFGKMYALIGPNGSGKTTFLKLLIGLLQPQRGQINGLKDQVIGYVPDYNGLYNTMSVQENIRFRISLYKKNLAEMDYLITDMLQRYSLYEDRKKLVKQLSLGMKKKVALICAMAAQPTILVLDEPTGGLDIHAHEELSKMLEEYISSDRIILFTSHDAEFLKSLRCETVNFPMKE